MDPITVGVAAIAETTATVAETGSAAVETGIAATEAVAEAPLVGAEATGPAVADVLTQEAVTKGPTDTFDALAQRDTDQGIDKPFIEVSEDDYVPAEVPEITPAEEEDEENLFIEASEEEYEGISVPDQKVEALAEEDDEEESNDGEKIIDIFEAREQKEKEEAEKRNIITASEAMPIDEFAKSLKGKSYQELDTMKKMINEEAKKRPEAKRRKLLELLLAIAVAIIFGTEGSLEDEIEQQKRIA